MTEQTTMTDSTQPLPQSSGLAPSAVLLPAAALFLGFGFLAFIVLRRR